MSDPFKQLVEQMARLSVPEDDTAENRERREMAASESGTQIRELDRCRDNPASTSEEWS
jgi:hypothetical protein